MASRSSSRTLTDHEEIRRWAEERGARPATVRSTHGQDNVGIIRLDFPGYSGADSLEEITWEEWFEDFDDNSLALLVQDETANGQKSNFNKLISRESAESGEPLRRESRGQASARSSRTRSSSSRGASSRSEAGQSRGRRASGSSRRGTRTRTRVSSSRASSAKKSSRSTSGRKASTAAQHRSQKKQSGRSSGSSRRRAA
jgi:hypothetical protein